MPNGQRGDQRGHSALVVPHDSYQGPRVWRFKCSCGAMSWDFDTKTEAREQADMHEVRAAEYDAREIHTDG